jgi:hypothetical protein
MSLSHHCLWRAPLAPAWHPVTPLASGHLPRSLKPHVAAASKLASTHSTPTLVLCSFFHWTESNSPLPPESSSWRLLPLGFSAPTQSQNGCAHVSFHSPTTPHCSRPHEPVSASSALRRSVAPRTSLTLHRSILVTRGAPRSSAECHPKAPHHRQLHQDRLCPYFFLCWAEEEPGEAHRPNHWALHCLV